MTPAGPVSDDAGPATVLTGRAPEGNTDETAWDRRRFCPRSADAAQRGDRLLRFAAVPSLRRVSPVMPRPMSWDRVGGGLRGGVTTRIALIAAGAMVLAACSTVPFRGTPSSCAQG